MTRVQVAHPPPGAHLKQQDAEARSPIASAEIIPVPQQLQHEGAAGQGHPAADHHHLRPSQAGEVAGARHCGGRDAERGRSQTEHVALHGHQPGQAKLQPHLEQKEDDAHLTENLWEG